MKGRGDGAWMPAELDEEQRDRLFDGDLALADAGPRAATWINRWGGLDAWRTCRGCLPREAIEKSFLCESCHSRLTEWLGLMPWLHQWLDQNVAPGNASGAKQDWQRPGSSDGRPLPLRVSVLDLRTLLTDRVLELEDCARDVFDRPARDQRFTVARAVRFLSNWQSRIEADMDLVVHVFDLLEDLVTKARRVVPWEDRPRRIVGIACPRCERAALEVRPGMEDVSCRSCKATIPKQRYEIWTRILASEAAAGGAG